MVYKKPVPLGLKTYSVPQTTGVSGWIVLTYDSQIPVCYWVSTHEQRRIPISVDERICGDTILRAEKIGDMTFVVSDIWLYNSNCVFACSTFRQRYVWLNELLTTFVRYIPTVTVELIHKSKLPSTVSIKGIEEHPEDMIGKPGYFVENDTSELVTIVKLGMPDCYEITPSRGYLRVPDIKTSMYLRKKGDQFKCKCVCNGDDSWTLVENIPELEVNA